MFKHDFKSCKFWQVEKPVLKFSAVLNIYNRHYLTAQQEHAVGNAEADSPGSKKHKLPNPMLWSNSFHEIQRTRKCILSDGGHCLILLTAWENYKQEESKEFSFHNSSLEKFCEFVINLGFLQNLDQNILWRCLSNRGIYSEIASLPATATCTLTYI